jgi:RNA polymerase sigma factor, sigma-70 family
MNEKYIFVNNKKVYVSDEVYRIYKQQQNREQYLKKLEKEYRFFPYADQDFNIEDVADERIDIERIVETKMRIEDLYKALDKLNADERNLINSIYFKEKTLRQLASEQNVSTKKIFNLKNKILKKLRKMLNN